MRFQKKLYVITSILFFPKSKIVIGFSAIIESLRETKLGKFARIDGLAAEHFFVHSHSSTFSTFIYMHVETVKSWACTNSIYENFIFF